MNVEELIVELKNNNIRKDAYSLTGGLPSEVYCFNKINNKWEIYYCERGVKTSQQFFESEDAACRTFLKNIINDTSTRV